MTDERKPAFNPKYSLDFNMGMADIQRLHDLLTEVHKLSVSVQSQEFEYILPYYNTLMEVYGCLLPIIKNEDDRKKLAGYVSHFNPIIVDIMRGRVRFIDSDDLAKLREFQFMLLYIKQWSGLGLPVSKEMTEKQKLARFLNE